MNDTTARKSRAEMKAERRGYYCAICEPDADNKTGADHRTEDHDTFTYDGKDDYARGGEITHDPSRS